MYSRQRDRLADKQTDNVPRRSCSAPKAIVPLTCGNAGGDGEPNHVAAHDKLAEQDLVHFVQGEPVPDI